MIVMNKILDEVKGATTIAIGGHIRPDGDCVGSCRSEEHTSELQSLFK